MPKCAGYDELYVRQILTAAAQRPLMTREQFEQFTQIDRNASYQNEVDEAFRRYFKD